MHQLGLTASDVTAFLHREGMTSLERLEVHRSANLHAGMSSEAAQSLAMIQLLQEFASSLLEANNRKIAADLVRLGVLTGTLTKGGEATF